MLDVQYKVWIHIECVDHGGNGELLSSPDRLAVFENECDSRKFVLGVLLATGSQDVFTSDQIPPTRFTAHHGHIDFALAHAVLPSPDEAWLRLGLPETGCLACPSHCAPRE